MLYDAIPPSDFYSLLQIPRDAPAHDIKIAYHRTLLRLHPDKQSQPRIHHSTAAVVASDSDSTRSPPPPPEEASVDVALLKEAYRTLSDASLRAAYDGSLRRKQDGSRGPRPAQVVSLDEFTVVRGQTMTDTRWNAVQEWRYGCRCGGTYHITQDDLENGTHLAGCESCSEAIWVGYEEEVSEDEGCWHHSF